MDSPATGSTGPSPPQEDRARDEQGADAAEHKIDLHALAEKVYALLKQELRLERERRGRP
jgi:hypothetical protein